LAFDNISGDTQQDYFSDGISTTSLSTLRFSLRGHRRKILVFLQGKPSTSEDRQGVGRQYVLEEASGSPATSPDHAQLVSTGDGHHLWPNATTAGLDIFQLQDEIAKNRRRAVDQVDRNEREMLARRPRTRRL
jgi:TolB-like protein